MTIDTRKLRSLIYPAILSIFLLGALGATVASGLFIGREINTAMSASESLTPSADLALDIQTVRLVAAHLNVNPSVTPPVSPLPTTPLPPPESLPPTEEPATSTPPLPTLETTSTLPVSANTSTTSAN